MNSTTRFIAALCVVAGAALAFPAAAQPPPPAGAKAKQKPPVKKPGKGKKADSKAQPLDQKGARKDKKKRADDPKDRKDRKDRKDKKRADDPKDPKDRKDRKDKKRADDPKDRKEKAAKGHEAFKARMQELHKTRKARRKARRAEFKKQWGEKAHKQAPIRAELLRHSWRMARLNRIRHLAEAEGKDELLAKVEKLSVKERDRHKKRLQKLKAEKSAPAATPDDPSKSKPAKGAAPDKRALTKGPMPAPGPKGKKPPVSQPPATPEPPAKSTKGKK